MKKYLTMLILLTAVSLSVRAQSSLSDPAYSGGKVSINLAQSTYVPNNSTKNVYEFESGGYNVSISNTRNKTFSAGSEDGIKYYRDVQYTIKIPTEIVITEVVFTIF